MKTAAYIGKLQSVGVDPKVAQAHGEALENAVGDSYVTKEFLSNRLEVTEARTDARFDTMESRMEAKFDSMDAKFGALESRIDAKFDALESRVDAKFDNFKAQFYQAMFLQGIAIVGLTAGLIKLMK